MTKNSDPKPPNTKRGGEPDAARLLELARAELLTHLLPQLQGDARYRARLIANALKLARHELAPGTGPGTAPETVEEDAATGAALAALVPAGTASLGAALRAGRLDGNAELHALLVRLTERRRAAAG